MKHSYICTWLGLGLGGLSSTAVVVLQCFSAHPACCVQVAECATAGEVQGLSHLLLSRRGSEVESGLPPPPPHSPGVPLAVTVQTLLTLVEAFGPGLLPCCRASHCVSAAAGNFFAAAGNPKKVMGPKKNTGCSGLWFWT